MGLADNRQFLVIVDLFATNNVIRGFGSHSVVVDSCPDVGRPGELSIGGNSRGLQGPRLTGAMDESIRKSTGGIKGPKFQLLGDRVITNSLSSR